MIKKNLLLHFLDQNLLKFIITLYKPLIKMIALHYSDSNKFVILVKA